MGFSEDFSDHHDLREIDEHGFRRKVAREAGLAGWHGAGTCNEVSGVLSAEEPGCFFDSYESDEDEDDE